MTKLDGKVATVSGSRRGVARKIAGQGCAVAVYDLDEEPAARIILDAEAAAAWAVACASSATDDGASRSASSAPRWTASAAWTSSRGS